MKSNSVLRKLGICILAVVTALTPFSPVTSSVYAINTYADYINTTYDDVTSNSDHIKYYGGIMQVNEATGEIENEMVGATVIRNDGTIGNNCHVVGDRNNPYSDGQGNSVGATIEVNGFGTGNETSYYLNIATVTINNGTVVNNKVGKVMVNNGTVRNNAAFTVIQGGTIETNNGYVEQNDGLVKTNIGSRYISESNTVEKGILSNTGTGVVETNKGFIGSNEGTVQSNSTGTVLLNSGTVTVNAGTVTQNTGTVTDNAGTVTQNSGTVTTNTGTVSQEDSGTVTNSYGGTVTGGTVTNHFGSVQSGTTATILHQYWAFSSENFEMLGITRGTANSDYLSDSSENAVGDLWLQGNETSGTTHSVVMGSAVAGQKLVGFEITSGDGNATFTDNGNGTWTISNVSGSISVKPLFADAPIITEDEHKTGTTKAFSPIQLIISGTDSEGNFIIVPTIANSVEASSTSASEDAASTVNSVSVVGVWGKNGVAENFNIAPATVSNNVYEASIIANEFLNIAAKENLDIKKASIIKYLNISAKKGSNIVLNIKDRNFNTTDNLFGVYVDSVTGKSQYSRLTMNPDGTVSFKVPFDNCLMTIVKM